jgi:hypothetical protein
MLWIHECTILNDVHRWKQNDKEDGAQASLYTLRRGSRHHEQTLEDSLQRYHSSQNP